MSKEGLKESYIKTKGKICALCGLPIEGEYSLIDTDRVNPKANGGGYDAKNYRIAHPICHMKRHGTFRKREEEFENLKALVDDRKQVMKTYMKINNQLLAYQRKTDILNEQTVTFLEEERQRVKKVLDDRDKKLKRAVREYAELDSLAKSALQVKGVGEVTVAYCLVYIDLEKARHASSLWKYAGLHTSSHERFTKGKSSGGNKNLRTILYTMADSQVKSKGAYRGVYDRAKAKKERSVALVKSRNTKGQLIECSWKDVKPSHRHGHGLRIVMKNFLADWWWVGRTLKGLPTDSLYAESVLKSGHKTIEPKKRGWIY